MAPADTAPRHAPHHTAPHRTAPHTARYTQEAAVKKEVAPALKEGKALEAALEAARAQASKAAALEGAAKVVLDRARKAASSGVLLSDKELKQIADEVGGGGVVGQGGRRRKGPFGWRQRGGHIRLGSGRHACFLGACGCTQGAGSTVAA